LFCFVFSNQALSQSMPKLDQDFLEGLDPSLKEAFEDSRGEDAEEAALENLFRSETSIEKNKIILKSLQEQLKRLSESMEGKDTLAGNRLPRFGDAFFRSIQSSFMPINMPNLGSNYIIDVGDTFTILLTGKTNKELTLEVQRDGSLLIPQIGQIQVAGKSLQETQAIMSEFMKSVALGVNHYLTLSEIRDVQILMTGGVEQPGIYTLSGGSSILHALNVAGGVSEKGSYRKVSLKRDGELIETFDLYDIFINGSFKSNRTLRSGDAIIVDSIGPLVPLSGGVVNEGLYEVLPSETADDMIRFAGGFSEGFSGFSSLLIQRSTLDKTQLITLDVEKLKSFEINYRDSILVPSYHSITEPILEIRLEGSVQKPGIYFVTKGQKLSDVIARAGGYTNDAYTYGGALFRKEALEKEQFFARVNYGDTIKNLLGMMGRPGTSLISSSSVDLMLKEMKAAEYTGRVLTTFDLYQLKQDPTKDISLKDQDRIVIPSLQKTVYMFGEFRSPVNVAYQPDRGIHDYLKFSGGLDKNAIDSLIIIDPDGTVHNYKLGRFFSKDIPIYPGSIIYAQRDAGKVEGIYFASILAPVLSSLALSLASLNSISD
ncbi:SLBB domain-containing protein, partial [Gammaproteobacteria bacterium]|nr:SLBB domain-containing protein [Gammaproteobacteria bacterium]